MPSQNIRELFEAGELREDSAQLGLIPFQVAYL